MKAYKWDNNRNYYDYVPDKEDHTHPYARRTVSNPAPSDGVD